jgi:hypothetical protein
LFLGLLGAAAAVPASADSTLYTNGAPNYTNDAWTINDGFSTTDSFTLSVNSTVTGFTFDVWLNSGDTLSSVDWSIGGTPYGGTPATATTSSTFIETNGFPLDVYAVTVTGLNDSLAAGSYYLTFQNAVVSIPLDGAYWEENDGPSLAQNSEAGAIGSETFTIQGISTATPEPSSFLLLGSGLAGLAAMLRRKIRA